MSRRYCINCGDALAEGQKYCINCGTVNEEPKKKKLENTEPLNYVPVPEEPAEPVEVAPLPVFPEEPEEPAVPVVEETAELEVEEAAEDIPAEETVEEPAEDAAEEETADTGLVTFPETEDEDEETEPIVEAAEPMEEGDGTEELPVITEEDADAHMNPMLADTNSIPATDTAEIMIQEFPTQKRSAGGTDILDGTPIDESVTTRVYQRPMGPEAAAEALTEESETVDEDYYEDEEESSSRTELLIAILIILLALLIGAFAYIWFLRPDLLHRKPKPAAPAVSVVDSEGSEVSSAVDSENPEIIVDSEQGDAADTPDSVELSDGKETIDLTKPSAVIDPQYADGDPVSVPDVDPDSVIGYANVHVESLLVRDGHSVTAEILGHARYTAHYEVIDIFDDGEYTWYEIADDMWIADSAGQWITFEK